MFPGPGSGEPLKKCGESVLDVPPLAGCVFEGPAGEFTVGCVPLDDPHPPADSITTKAATPMTRPARRWIWGLNLPAIAAHLSAHIR